MGIFDEAIKEHLELKRQHGAGDSELKKLEDEAFGPPERPSVEAADSLAEAPTEFMPQPEAIEGLLPRRRAPDIADLQEAPEPEPPAEEEQPAMEHEAVRGPEPEPESSTEEQPPAKEEPPAGPSTEERHAIAEQPTELHDVEGEIEDSEPRAPSEEELIEEEIGEPRLAPIDPLAGLDPDEGGHGAEQEIRVEAAEGEEKEADEDEDDFFDEQRLSDELDQALEAPQELEPEEDFESEEAPSPGADEDLLEETPDFLEEAPEDDRLWFEQKPPKDFDFDD